MAATDRRHPVTVRRARSTDAEALAALFVTPSHGTAVAATPGADSSTAVAAVRERISIPSGDDYFTLVAVGTDCGRVLGWCAAGGSVHQELKGWGEIYTLEVADGASTDDAVRALAVAAFERLALARYRSVAWWLAAASTHDAERAERVGFHFDGHVLGALRLYARTLSDDLAERSPESS